MATIKDFLNIENEELMCNLILSELAPGLAPRGNLMGGDINMLHKLSTHGYTLLHFICMYNMPKAVKLLIKHGANVDHCDIDNNTPLMSSVSFDYLECVKLLIDNGANVNKISQGCTALSLLASLSIFSMSQLQCASLLLARGADPNFEYNGMTVFARVCFNNHLPLAIMIINSGMVDDLQAISTDRIWRCQIIIQVLYHIDSRNAEIEAKQQQMQRIKAASGFD